jgi:DNA-binding NarL/FixJ family response regulator
MIRIVVAEDNALLRDGMRRILEAQDDLEIVLVCGSLDELLAGVKEHSPDVVVTDIRMPPTGTDEGIRAAAELRTSHPEVGVVVLSQFVSPQYAVALLERGSEGRAYLLKDRVADVDDLVDAIREVARGGSVIDPKVVDELVRARSQSHRSPLDHLTPREGEVLGEMASGKSNAAIAGTLVLSERAVEKHINSIFSKLHLVEEADVNRRVKAVLLYLAAGT